MKTTYRWMAATLSCSLSCTHRGHFEAFRNTSEVCWNYLTRIRHLSLCSTCSGRGEVFFSRGKALVREASCSEIMSKCGNHFRQLIKFIMDAAKLTEKVYKKTTEASWTWLDTRNLLRQIHFVFSDLRRMHLAQKFRVFFNSSDQKERLNASDWISKRLTNLMHQTFVQKLPQRTEDLLLGNGFMFHRALGHLDRLNQSNATSAAERELLAHVRLIVDEEDSRERLEKLYRNHLADVKQSILGHFALLRTKFSTNRLLSNFLPTVAPSPSSEL